MAKKSNPKPSKITVISDEPKPATAAEGESKINKSHEIRVEAKKLSDAGITPGLRLIIEKLATRGISDVSPQVSQVLKSEGYARRPRKKKINPAIVAPKAEQKKPAKTTSGSFTVEELKAANKFVKTIGDASRAVELWMRCSVVEF